MIVCRLQILAWSQPPQGCTNTEKGGGETPKSDPPQLRIQREIEVKKHANLTALFGGGGILSRFWGWDTKSFLGVGY